ncbi:MAG TPA: amino acid adenylation domain-containing protein, partial [Thermoanaerobaculia bacterium]|nr:amino acid adenylation domain-containing protein [Thermoanaerobaculia bacterium]
LVDLAALPAGRRNLSLKQLADAEPRRPFDLVAGPLLRLRLLRLGAAEHVALLTVHHIVADAWSVGILVRELMTLYPAVVRREPSPLAELPIQYADFAAWQHGHLQGEALAGELSFWRSRLAGSPAQLELPADRPRPAIQSFHGGRYEVRLADPLPHQLGELAQREGATLFMVLLAGFVALLARHSGQLDVVVGSPVAGRRPETEGLIGLFINTLALRVDASGEPPFRSLLRRVREVCLDAYAHQDLPFERLVEGLGLQRDLSRAPVYQVGLTLQNMPLGRLELPGLALQPLHLEELTAKLDLAVNLTEVDGTLVGSWMFNTDLYDRATMRRMYAHHAALLRAAAAAPDRRLSELDGMSAAERHQLVGEWNDTAVAYRRELCLHELIAEQAARTPEAVAVLYEGESLTYGELERRSAALAARLAEMGAGAETRVGLAVERSLEMMVGVLAILKAGAAYVPLDPAYPPDRLSFMVADAMGGDRGGRAGYGDGGQTPTDAPLVLSQRRLAGRLPAAAARVLYLDDEPARPGGKVPRSRRALPDNLAYVIYTSGSTGMPKGAMNSHRAVVNRLLWMQQTYGLTAADRVLQKTPISFDVSVWELFWPLLAGATLVVARPGGHQDPAYLVQLIREQRITTLHLVPSMLQVFLEAPGVSALGSLRRVFASGEALPAELERRCHERLEAAALYNLYGPTEAAVDVTAWHCERGSRRTTVPIGRPVANTSIHLLDAAYGPVPIGVAGELYIGGVQPARGYLNRPELTAERFVPDPAADRSSAPGARMYRTGDLARRLADGTIEFLGRVDHQVKIRGFRIELGEIEAALAAHPAVREAVVLAQAGRAAGTLGDARLVACVVPSGWPPPSLEDLRGHLSRSLPEHMLPSALVLLAAMPTTPSGKADRRSLVAQAAAAVQAPQAAIAAPGAAMPATVAGVAGVADAASAAAAAAMREQVAPRTPLESHLAAMFAEVLGSEPVGVRDNFFALGGNSITGAVLINRLQQELGEIVHVVVIFDAPTVAQLADYLQREHPGAVARRFGATDEPAAVAVVPVPDRPRQIEGTEVTATDRQQQLQTAVATVPGRLPEPATVAAAAGRVDAGKLAELRRLLRPLALRPRMAAAKNPPAIFVLSPPRSGTTLLRVMLAGHPGLFAPPELELLSFGTMAERRAAFSGRDSFWLEGLLRAVMEARGVDAAGAAAIVEEAERQDWDTADLYALMQSWLGERRLVDKTPSYALDPAVLARAEEVFAEPFYIHLVRHPYGMIHSFEEAKLDQLFFRYPHRFARRELAELIWTASHQNILERLGALPARRHHRVIYEELVAQPEQVLRSLCGALGIAFHADMAQPYKERERRMTDGIHRESRMLGDVKFHLHKGVDAGIAWRWRQDYREDFLGEPTWEMAARLGLPVAPPSESAAPGAGAFAAAPAAGAATVDDADAASAWHALRAEPERTGVPLPLSFAQERLWFLDQLHPGSAAYNIPAAVRLRGDLQPAALAQAFREVVRRHSVLRARFLSDGSEPAQVIAEVPPPAPLPCLDLSALPEGPRHAERLRLVAAAAALPFDLATGPLVSLALLRLQPAEHVVLLTMHHIVSDGWSMGLLIRELAALYAAFARRQPSPLSALAIQYTDFARWQRAWLSGAVLDRQLAYWRQALTGVPIVQLPTDRPRPPVESFRGAERGLLVDGAAGAPLLELGQRLGATPFMSLLAVFAVLLSRLSGQLDIAVGTPSANRIRAELEGLIGFFVNTLVLRIDVAGEVSFAELLARVRQASLAAFAHQDLPFEKIVFELQPERDLSRSPLFQVMFALQDGFGSNLALPDLSLEGLPTDSGVAKFDLTLSLNTGPRGISGTLGYKLDLFDGATAERWLRHFAALLAAAAAEPHRRVAELPLLAAAERQQLLVEGSDTAADCAWEGSVDELVERWAVLAPGRLAVTAGLDQRSYGALAAGAAQVAGRLRSLGISRGEPVAVAIGRSVRLLEVLLGVWRAGGAYVPMDPAYPAERLLHMLEDAGCRLLLADQDTPQDLVRRAAEVVWIEDGGSPHTPPGVSPPPSPRSPSDLAYVLYTSGSTGRPKGVEVSHGALLNFLRSMARRPGLGPEDVLLAVTSLSFDIAALELYLPLLVGARLELVERDVAADGMRLLGSLTGSGATVLQATPSTWRLLVEAGWQASPGLKALCGGEALPERLAAELVARAAEVWNLYGPTETTVWSAADRVEAGAPVRIGPPIANTSLVLMSRELEPVALGVAGELWIGGAGVARGYRGRPELTAERFVPDPLAGRSSAPGARLYRTGDLARHDGHGRLEFLGRIDHQVKVRGFRIELGEVESALESHPAVERAVAVADGVGGGRLVAYVVPRQPPTPPAPASPAAEVPVAAATAADGAPEPAANAAAGNAANAAGALAALVPALRAHLAATLPDYMIPTAWVELASVPLTPNGKVDRRALPAVEEQARPYVAPRTPVEELLAGLFSEVLERAQVGVHDNFFDLGGHSLIATRLMARVRDAVGVELPLRKLFEGPTVAALAQAIEPVLEERAQAQATQTAQAEQPEAATELAPVPRGQDLPLSFAQQRLWVLDQLEVAGTTYNIAVSLRLRGALSVAALAAALSELSARHESLRTSFPKVAGQPVQRIAPPRAAALPLVDLRRLTQASRQQETARVSATLTRQPFDLATGPLLRTALVALAQDEHLFALTVHHIVADGWSLGVLVHDLAAFYQAAVSGEPAGLAPLPVQYPDFAVWQRRWFAGDRLEAQLSYWRRQLAGLPPALPLAIDGPRQVGRGQLGTRHLRLTPARTADLRELARREQATPFMVRLAAFAALLWRHTGQEDIAIGTPIANRERVELEPMIGFFVNTLVMRIDLAGDPDFRTLLARVRERALDAYAHQDLPFERLVEELAPERDLRLNPLFQVMLQVGNLPLAPISLTGLQLVPVPAARGQAMFDLLLSVAEQGDELLGTLDYDAELLAGATCERLARHYTALLLAAAAEPGRRLAELPLLDDAERQQLLGEWNDTAAAYREDLCLHELIAAQAARHPDAVAVVYEEASLTYGELARASAALASRLIALGVGAESRVGLAVERSLEMMVGVLAILQAGGAYVPLDPDYPRDRLAYMVADAMSARSGGGQPFAAPPVVLSLRRLADRLPDSGAQVVFLDETTGVRLPAAGRDLAGEHRTRRALPDNLAYVIYTSGSTGLPKGAMNSHRAVVNRLLWMQQTYGLTAADRVLQKTPISFDVSVWE